MDSNAEFDHLNLAHVARKNMKKEESKTNASAQLVQHRIKIREVLPGAAGRYGVSGHSLAPMKLMKVTLTYK